MASPDASTGGHARLALLHLCDSLFPLGAFAHSDGLETVVAAGTVSSGADLREWLLTIRAVTLTAAEGPIVRDALAAARQGDTAALAALDDESFAMRCSASAREASTTMGTRLLTTWQHLRPAALVQKAIDARARHTFPVAFAVVCVASAVPGEQALEAYCYTRLSATISAAMRLMSIGQNEAHALLTEMLLGVPECVERIQASDEPPRAFAPVMDIAAMGHQFVHSRLFRT